MGEIPRDPSIESGPALLREGYEFIGNRCRRYGSDLFETRLMLERTICMTGPGAARVFYEPGRFTRRRAMPPTALKLLQDFGSVALLDGEHHRQRKGMFMSLMTPARLRELCDVAAEEWLSSLRRWEGPGEIVLLDEVRELLCRAVCSWAGVPLAEHEVTLRTRQLAAMIDGAGSMGPRNWRGQLLRSRAERWARQHLERVRSGELTPPKASALHVIASHREPDGNLLDVGAAAVELLNVLRPTVAVGNYVVFAALALYEHPEARTRLQAAEPGYAQSFVNEVRRYYPFFPFVGGRVAEEFEWRGNRFERGQRFMLDLYGTNRDERSWEQATEFRPDRFLEREAGAFDLIPQGGGEYDSGHRCAGEWATTRLVEVALEFLTGSMTYRVPAQDLSVDLGTMPALPASRMIISDIRAKRATATV